MDHLIAGYRGQVKTLNCPMAHLSCPGICGMYTGGMQHAMNALATPKVQ